MGYCKQPKIVSLHTHGKHFSCPRSLLAHLWENFSMLTSWCLLAPISLSWIQFWSDPLASLTGNILICFICMAKYIKFSKTVSCGQNLNYKSTSFDLISHFTNKYWCNFWTPDPNALIFCMITDINSISSIKKIWNRLGVIWGTCPMGVQTHDSVQTRANTLYVKLNL